jgi:hypothetical protein
MTLAWFGVWLIASLFGGTEAIVLDPVNGWAATLILAAGIDLARAA